jgi:hypothetical protein
MRRSLKQRSPMKYEKAASTDQGTIKMPKDFVAKATIFRDLGIFGILEPMPVVVSGAFPFRNMGTSRCKVKVAEKILGERFRISRYVAYNQMRDSNRSVQRQR